MWRSHDNAIHSHWAYPNIIWYVHFQWEALLKLRHPPPHPDTNRLLCCRKSLRLKPKTWKSGADTIPGNFTRWEGSQSLTSYFLPGRKGRVIQLKRRFQNPFHLDLPRWDLWFSEKDEVSLIMRPNTQIAYLGLLISRKYFFSPICFEC